MLMKAVMRATIKKQKQRIETLEALILAHQSYFDYDKQRDFCVFCGGTFPGGFDRTISHREDCIVKELEERS